MSSPLENKQIAAQGVDRTGLAALSRDQVAHFLKSREHEIRAVARTKLTNRARSINDSEDVYSSVLRRMDELALKGEVRPRSESELWALAKAIASNEAVSKTRLAERAKALITQDGEYARILVERLEKLENDDEAMLLLLRLASTLTDSADRQMLFLRMRGANHKVIADTLGISHDACRQRWTVLKARLECAIRSGM